MSGSNGQCCTSEPDPNTINPDGMIEEDGFITIVATGWTPPGVIINRCCALDTPALPHQDQQKRAESPDSR